MARRHLAAVKEEQPRDRPPDLRDAVKAALDQMTWLGPSDEAIRALAMRQAEEIEKAADRAAEFDALRSELISDPSAYKRLQKLEAMCDLTKVVGWLGPQLQGVLRDLGGTPGARGAFAKDKPIGGRLAQLRANAATAAGKDDS